MQRGCLLHRTLKKKKKEEEGKKATHPMKCDS